MNKFAVLSLLALSLTACPSNKEPKPEQKNTSPLHGRWEGNWMIDGTLEQPERLYITDEKGVLTAQIQLKKNDQWEPLSFILTGKSNSDNIIFEYNNKCQC